MIFILYKSGFLSSFYGFFVPSAFYAFLYSEKPESLKKAMIFYPVLISFFFLFPVLIGIWAHGAGIVIDKSDNVLPLMVKNFAPKPVFSFVMIGALAALMSTADSQLLALSTMLTCDIFGKKVEYDAKVGIMGTLVKTTFSGLVVLFPATFATLYWRKATKWGCITSILMEEAVVFLYYSYDLPSFGFLPAIAAFSVATLVLIAVSALMDCVFNR